MTGSARLRRRLEWRTPSRPSQSTGSSRGTASACSFSRRTHWLPAGAERSRRVRFRIDEDADERHVHLIPALRSVADGFRGVGIEFVRAGIIVARDRLYFRALRKIERLRQLIADLPVEPVIRHAQECLFFARRVDDRELVRL